MYGGDGGYPFDMTPLVCYKWVPYPSQKQNLTRSYVWYNAVFLNFLSSKLDLCPFTFVKYYCKVFPETLFTYKIEGCII